MILMRRDRLKAKGRRSVYVILLILITLVLAGTSIASAAEVDAARSTHVFFHTGSPLLLDGDRVLSLDPANPDVAATVINSRTLLPLRAFAEHFGAVVSLSLIHI